MFLHPTYQIICTCWRSSGENGCCFMIPWNTCTTWKIKSNSYYPGWTIQCESQWSILYSYYQKRKLVLLTGCMHHFVPPRKLTWKWTKTTLWRCICYTKDGDFPASHVSELGGVLPTIPNKPTWPVLNPQLVAHFLITRRTSQLPTDNRNQDPP